MTRPYGPRVIRGCALVLGAALVLACGRTNAPAGASGGSTSRARPGYAVGRLSAQKGGPITAEGAKFTIFLHGVASKSGEKVTYDPKVNADGTYEQKLVDGSYSFSGARLEAVFQGKHFAFDLEAVGDDRSDRESDKGIVQDYVWKLTGPRPGQDADESNFTHWYGASVNMRYQGYREDLKKSVAQGPPGTKCVFTLVPSGKLVDGSPGRVLSFTREYDPLLGGLKNGNLPDIPLGVYDVTGEEISPEGSKSPLLMQVAFGKYGPSTKVEFAPGSTVGAWPANVGFTRGN